MGRRPLSSSQEKDSPSGRLCGAPSPIDLTTGSKCVIPQWSSQSPSGWTSSYGTSWSLQPASPSRGVPPRPPGIVSSTSQWREDPTEASRTGWSVSLLGLEVLASDPSLTLLVQPSSEPSSRPSPLSVARMASAPNWLTFLVEKTALERMHLGKAGGE